MKWKSLLVLIIVIAGIFWAVLEMRFKVCHNESKPAMFVPTLYTEKVLTQQIVKQFLPSFEYLGEHDYNCNGIKRKVSEYKHTPTGIEFVLVQSGSFLMGNNQGEEDERPVHKVIIGPFLMSKYEITQEIWTKIMGTTPWKGQENTKEEKQCAAAYINWHDAQAFCKKTGLLLPTEAQWEYAYRAGRQTKFYWGEKMDDSYSWYVATAWEKGERYAHPVGLKQPNAFGLYDMSGNVYEWCRDNYGDYPKEEQVNPVCVNDIPRRNLRGGGFLNTTESCSGTDRDDASPEFVHSSVGFRVCAELFMQAPSKKER